MECDRYINKYDLDKVEDIGKLDSFENYSFKNMFKVCESGWTKFIIKDKQKCMKNFGIHRVHTATKVCRLNNAKLPLPQSERANIDTYAAFKGVKLTSISFHEL